MGKSCHLFGSQKLVNINIIYIDNQYSIMSDDPIPTNTEELLLTTTSTPLIYDDTISTSSIQQVLFVSAGASPLETYANAETFTIVYDSSSTLEDIWELMRRKFSSSSTLNRIGFAFHNHGDLTRFCNRDTWFSDTDLDEARQQPEFSQNAQFMFDFLREFKVTHVDFLACKTLQSEKWRKYYQLIQTQTGVIVGASEDDTGNVKYGGDWVLESTMEDIRDVYFTGGIENYTSLLAPGDYTIIANLTGARTVTVLDYYLYTAAGTMIYKINLRTKQISLLYNVVNAAGIYGMCAYGNFLYFQSGASSVGKLNISDGTVVLDWISDITEPDGMVTDGTYLYVSSYTQPARIVRVPFTFAGGTIGTTYDFIISTTPGDYFWNFCIYGAYLYVMPVNKNRIIKYNLSNGSLETGMLSNASVSGTCLWAYNGFLYVGDAYINNPNTLTQISLDAEMFVSNSFFSNQNPDSTYTRVYAITAYEKKLYCATRNLDAIISIDIPVYTLNKYYYTFYTVSATTPTVMSRTIYDNAGNLMDTTDISYGGQNITDVLTTMNGISGTNPFSVGTVDQSRNKIKMDLAYSNVFTKALTSTQKTKLMSYVNTTFKEPHTIFANHYIVTFIDGKFWVALFPNGVASNSTTISFTAGNTYIFDQSHVSNIGKPIVIYTSDGAIYTTGVTTIGTSGQSVNAYTQVVIPAGFSGSLFYNIPPINVAGIVRKYSTIGPTTTSQYGKRITMSGDGKVYAYSVGNYNDHSFQIFSAVTNNQIGSTIRDGAYIYESENIRLNCTVSHLSLWEFASSRVTKKSQHSRLLFLWSRPLF